MFPFKKLDWILNTSQYIDSVDGTFRLKIDGRGMAWPLVRPVWNFEISSFSPSGKSLSLMTKSKLYKQKKILPNTVFSETTILKLFTKHSSEKVPKNSRKNTFDGDIFLKFHQTTGFIAGIFVGIFQLFSEQLSIEVQWVQCRVLWQAPVIQGLWRPNFGMVWVRYQLGVTVL